MNDWIVKLSKEEIKEYLRLNNKESPYLKVSVVNGKTQKVILDVDRCR